MNENELSVGDKSKKEDAFLLPLHKLSCTFTKTYCPTIGKQHLYRFIEYVNEATYQTLEKNLTK